MQKMFLPYPNMVRKANGQVFLEWVSNGKMPCETILEWRQIEISVTLCLVWRM